MIELEAQALNMAFRQERDIVQRREARSNGIPTSNVEIDELLRLRWMRQRGYANPFRKSVRALIRLRCLIDADAQAEPGSEGYERHRKRAWNRTHRGKVAATANRFQQGNVV